MIAPSGSTSCEPANDFDKSLRLLEMRRMRGRSDGLEPRAWNEAGVGGRIFVRKQAVQSAPDQERRPVNPVQPMLELGIVHVRLPSDQRQGLPIAGDGEKLLVGKLGRVELPFLRLDIEQALELMLGHGEYVRDVEPVDRTDLDPDRGDQP